MSETTQTADQPTIPAGPDSPRQRTYLMSLVSDVTELRDTLTAIRENAAREIADLEAGKSVRLGMTDGPFAGLATTAVRLRAKIDVRVESRHAFGITDEQVNYAIHLGGLPTHGERDDAEAQWLYSTAF